MSSRALLASPLGFLIGVSLGALGGGGSILAVPVLVFVAGQKPGAATTTSLFVVGVASLIGAYGHWRSGRVRVAPGLVFGLVGIGGYPTLIDGGSVTAPHFAFWNPDGKWDVENVGVSPDIEVEMDPQAWRAGRDPQLEKAVEVVLAALQKNPLPKHKKPAYPNYHPRAATAGR